MDNYPYTDKWGRKTARERYGSNSNQSLQPVDKEASYPQKLGDKNNLRGPDWQDDHANDWVRGGPNESAEGKPGFDKSKT